MFNRLSAADASCDGVELATALGASRACIGSNSSPSESESEPEPPAPACAHVAGCCERALFGAWQGGAAVGAVVVRRWRLIQRVLAKKTLVGPRIAKGQKVIARLVQGHKGNSNSNTLRIAAGGPWPGVHVLIASTAHGATHGAPPCAALRLSQRRGRGVQVKRGKELRARATQVSAPWQAVG